jgi:hypothetical protein
MGSIIEWGKHKHYCITSERKYSGESGVLTSKKGNIKERRLATPDEKELFYKHFPKKRKVWIEVWENEDGYIWADAFDKETELKESQKYNKASGFKSLEVIEREY